MRKIGIAEVLFPKAREQILSTLLLDEEHAWYLSDLAKHNKTAPSSLQRELASLVESGILIKTWDGNRTYYKADQECPVFSELKGLFTKTSGLVDQVRKALIPLAEDMQFAFVYGSVAANSERSRSDVDLLIVGSISLIELTPILKPLQVKLSRQVNVTLYSQRDFSNKVATGHHFLGTVLEGPKLFIIGTARDLDSIAERGEGKTAPDEQAGD